MAERIDNTLKVEILMQLCINGRPVWIKSKRTKAENTLRMTDKEYDRILDAANKELSLQVNSYQEKQELVKK